MTRNNSFSKATWGTRTAGAAAALIGGYWLAIWFTGGAAQDLAVGEVIPKTNTALCLLLAGISLLMLSESAPTRIRRIVGAALAMTVFLIGALTLSEHLLGWNLGIDQLLLDELPGATFTVSPNRMGPPASISMALLGAGLLTLAWERRRGAPYFGLLVCLINFVPAVGFIYGVQSFHDLPRFTFIAWHTVAALILLGAGLMMAPNEAGSTALLFRNNPGGALLRKMLPAVILIPLVLGFFQIQGEVLGFYDTVTGTGHLTIILILIFLLILWRSADQLNLSAETEAKAHQTVKESERRFRTVADFTYDWEFWRDPEGRFLYCSPSCEWITGHNAEEFLTDSGLYARLIHPDDHARFSEHMRNVEEKHTSGETEWRYLHLDGTWRWICHVCRPLFDDQGGYLGSRGSNRDITARKQAEEAASRSQKTVFELVERSPFGIYIVDSRFCIAHMNASSQAGAFKNVRPVIGRNFAEAMRILWPEPVAADIIATFRHTLDTGGPYYSPTFFNPRNDIKAVEGYEWELHRMRLPDGQYGVICYYFDSTKLRTAEEALRESEERFRALNETSPIGVGVSSTDGVLIYTNPAYELLLGYSRAELVGKKASDLYMNPDDRVSWLGAMKEGGAVRNAETRLKRKDGTPVWVSISTSYIHYNGEQAVIGTIHDITERKQAEAALRASEERLRSLTENVPCVLMRFDRHLRIVYLNKQADRYNPHPVDQMIGRTNIEMGMPEHLCDLWDAATKRVFCTGNQEEMEFDFAGPSGMRTFALKFAPEFGPNHEVQFVLGVSTDITDRKRVEAALRESEERLQLTLQSCAVGTYEVDLTTGVGRWNSVEYELLGLKPGDAPPGPETFFRYVHPQDIAELRSQWGKATRTGNLDAEFRVIRADGQEH